MKLVFDAGALVALERGNRIVWARFTHAIAHSRSIITHGGVVGQVWRSRGPRQARLARALPAIDVRPLDRALGKLAGELLAKAHARDVIDAAIVLLADDGDEIFTSDCDDLEPLARASGVDVDFVPV